MEAAQHLYTVEMLETPKAKRWGSAAFAWLTALFTFGGGATPIVGQGVRIRDRAGSVLAEHHDDISSYAGTYESAVHDLETLSAEEFAARWLS